MSKRTRQYIGILAAAVTYYIVHEGAHLLAALSLGAFKAVRFMGLGMQIDIYAERLNDTQLGLFCLSGPAATLIAGYALTALSGRICRTGRRAWMAALYYITLALLLLDPVYMSVLCDLFGGGDMNGIALLVPQVWARVAFGLLFIGNLALFWKRVLPQYRAAFA